MFTTMYVFMLYAKFIVLSKLMFTFFSLALFCKISIPLYNVREIYEEADHYGFSESRTENCIS